MRMSIRRFCVMFVFFSLVTSGLCGAKERIDKQDLLKILDPIVSKTLAAYNADDDVNFFDYYAQRMHDITNAKYFKEYYAGAYKEKFGDYIIRTLLEKKSSFDLAYPVLVYKAEFRKEKKALITVTFMNEHGFYRVTNVEFTKIHFEDY